jgi:hypothetical protein
MKEGIQQRCRRICDGESAQCFIHNKKQLSCLSDMLINNVYGIASILEYAMDEEFTHGMRENISEALNISRNLIDWVKYLQITHDIRQIQPIHQNKEYVKKRSEQRYPLPELYKQYFDLTLQVQGMEVAAQLVNFSRNGLQFKSQAVLGMNEIVDGTLHTRHLVGKTVHFKATARYVLVSGEEYITGAKVTEVSDSGDFDFFHSVHEFILEFIPLPPELRPIGTEGRYEHKRM